MKVTVKMLQGAEHAFEVSPTTTGKELKDLVAKELTVSQDSQRLVFKGRTLPDEATLTSSSITENAKIFLMVKKGNETSEKSEPKSSVESSPSKEDLFVQLESLLKNHLTIDQRNKVMDEFRKRCKLLIESMNFEDIERFAASNFAEF